jgi:hypothetical protein
MASAWTGGRGLELERGGKILSDNPAKGKMRKGGLYDMLDNNMIYDSLRVNHCVSRW